nr:unnamed protein product [Callosobruchus analis]
MFLNSNNVDIICLSEHWIQQKNVLTQMNIYGYRLVSAYCRPTRIHGGVCMFVKKNIFCKVIDIGSFCLEASAEFCALELSQQNMIIIVVYRSCLADISLFFDKFEELLYFISGKYEKIVILGDFNIHFNLSNEKYMIEFSPLIARYGLSATISENTRFGITGDSCVDNILTNLPESGILTGVLDPAIKSDHIGQFIEINLEISKKTSKSKYRKITKKGLDKLYSLLEDLNWQNFYDLQDIDESAKFLLNNCQTLVRACFPLKVQQISNSPVNWFNDELKCFRNRVAAANTISRVRKDDDSKHMYNILHAQYKKLIVETKKAAYAEMINRSDNKAKSIWRIVNHERNMNNKTESLKEISANEFNIFFSNIINEIVASLNVNPTIQREIILNIAASPVSFFLEPVTENDILTAISGMKVSNSFDVYDFNSIILRRVKSLLARPLAYLFNHCISSGKFPEPFKLSRAVPIFKKGDPAELNNYRPVSIIPYLGKIFEIIISQRLHKYLEKYNLFSNNQFGFRKGRSTVHLISKIVSLIIDAFENREYLGLSLCDLSKAFDSISVDLLINKLERYGIRGTPLNLIKSYLSGRKQCVVVDDTKSDIVTLKYGVPQGSVLGPLLFLTYVNDIYQYLQPYACFSYADDTTLVSTDPKLAQLHVNMECLEQKAERWFSNSNLKLNMNKTQKIVFSSDAQYTSGNTVKTLGIVLDDRLSWKPHTTDLRNTLSCAVFALRRLSKLVGQEILLTVYYAIFHSRMSYGITLWGNSTGAVEIFKIQKKAVRIVSGIGYRDSCRKHFVSLRIMPLPTLFMYYQLLETHKHRAEFEKNMSYHNYLTRTRTQLRDRRFRLARSAENSINIKLYNHLPNSFKNLSCYDFKKSLKRYLLDQCFYSVDEFLVHRVVSH